MSHQTLATAQLHPHDLFVCSQCPAACCSQAVCTRQRLHLAAARMCRHPPARVHHMPCRACLTDSKASSSDLAVAHLCPGLPAGLAWPALCRLMGGPPPLRLRRAPMGTAWRASASSSASNSPANSACGCQTRPETASSRLPAGENCPTDWQLGLLHGAGASAQACFQVLGVTFSGWQHLREFAEESAPWLACHPGSSACCQLGTG